MPDSGGTGSPDQAQELGTASARGAHIAAAIRKAAAELERRLEATLGRLELSLAKYGVLHSLAAAEQPLALSDLAARLACVRSNITQLVDRLEAEGLVKRIDDPTDRRSVLAELTPKGQDLERAGAEAIRSVHLEIASRVPEGGVPDLLRGLSALE